MTTWGIDKECGAKAQRVLHDDEHSFKKVVL